MHIPARRRVAVLLLAGLLAIAPAFGTTAAAAPESGGYHSYAEVQQAVLDAAAGYPMIARADTAGHSYEGRSIPILRLGLPGDAPEVLFTCNQHGAEHLTAEMCLHIIERYTTGYGVDPEITRAVNSRVIWIIPMVNPDGAEFDTIGRARIGWRKNRQGLGTDPNRNWGFNWGCCHGSSGIALLPTYRGPEPFSAPETRAVRDFVNSRAAEGHQRIATHIDFHTFSEQVLWPMGYTTDDSTPELSEQDAAVFQALGRDLAATNGYKAAQASDFYITDGSMIDWMWATHNIWSYTVELYPTGMLGGAFYPPARVIERETARNDEAVALLLSYADCVPRVVGRTCS
ncbi:zinc carboxypeptidase [Pseudonocardiaceae bacterium YIM PH 21723]|nr:zinc carboxypeptidase [Pseudonocardiaceae bacterium YIM PH 21723]